jgi:AsmA protein
MGKLIKYCALIILLVLILITISLTALVIFVKPNDLKPLIEQQVFEHTHRHLKIHGDIHWSLWPNLGFVVNDVELGNFNAFKTQQNFVTVKQARASLSVAPLLKKEVIINEVALKGATLNLIKIADGSVNWKKSRVNKSSSVANTTVDLVTPSPQQGAKVSDKQTKQKEFNFHILKFVLHDAHIHYTDNKSGKNFDVANFNFMANNIKENQFFPVRTSFELASLDPRLIGKVSIQCDFKPNWQNKTYNVKKLQIHTVLTGDKYPPILQTGKLDLLLKGDVVFSPNLLSLSNLEFITPKNTLKGDLKISGLQKMPAWDMSSFLQYAAVKGEIHAAPLKIYTAVMRSFSANINLAKGMLKLNPIKAQAYAGDLNITATIDARRKPMNAKVSYKYNHFNVSKLTFDLFNYADLSGTGYFNGNLNVRDINRALDTLNGKIKLSVLNGALQGINIPALIDTGRAIIKQDRLPSSDGMNQTNFNKLSMSAYIANSILKNKDLKIDSDHVFATGNGRLNLKNGGIRYYLTAKMKQADLQDWSIPIIILGNIKNPSVRVDSKKLLKNTLQNIIQKQAKEKLNIKNLPIDLTSIFN